MPDPTLSQAIKEAYASAPAVPVAAVAAPAAAASKP